MQVTSTDIMAMTAATVSVGQVLKSDAIPIKIDTPGKKRAMAILVAIGVSFWLVYIKNKSAMDLESLKYFGSAFISTQMASKGLYQTISK